MIFKQGLFEIKASKILDAELGGLWYTVFGKNSLNVYLGNSLTK